MTMPEETVKIAEKHELSKNVKSPRELTLENALKNAIAVVENQNALLARMGIRSLGSIEWIQETKDLLSVTRS